MLHLSCLFKYLGITQERLLQVLFTGLHLRQVDGPFYSHVRIVPADAGFGLWSIDVVYLIGENGFVAQYQETMCKAAGNEELPLVLVAELYHDVFAKRRTALAQVYCNVQHLTFYDAYELGLRELAFLVVQATQHTIAGLGFIVLYEVYRSNVGIKLTLLPTLEEIASTVSKHAWFYNIYALNGCFPVFHFLNIKIFSGCKVTIFFRHTLANYAKNL